MDSKPCVIYDSQTEKTCYDERDLKKQVERGINQREDQGKGEKIKSKDERAGRNRAKIEKLQFLMIFCHQYSR